MIVENGKGSWGIEARGKNRARLVGERMVVERDKGGWGTEGWWQNRARLAR